MNSRWREKISFLIEREKGSEIVANSEMEPIGDIQECHIERQRKENPKNQ